MCFHNEIKIIAAVLTALAANGYVFRSDVDENPKSGFQSDVEGILKTMTWKDGSKWCWATDESYITVMKPFGSNQSFIHVIFGNGNEGRDVISNNGVSISEIIDPVYMSDEAVDALLLLDLPAFLKA